ncbi:MAG: protein-export chaperone SecB [Alphaproteobacteria bacterium]|nr:protein-export chaperone SecB [Alphaproteobacteria bacterium]
MAETDAKTDAGAAEAQAGPRVTVRVQYVKDLSFENPGAPRALADTATPPQIQVNVDVEARPMGKDHYEVALHINATAARNDANVFVLELVYAGLFALENIPRDKLENICLVECPRLLFPFARRVVADATREGGFPPLLLDPIDFARLLRQHRGPMAASGQATAAPAKRGK